MHARDRHDRTLAAERADRFRSGFTLTEILVAISIIVLITAVAVPAFRAITGSRSNDAAINQSSALLSRARTESIGRRGETNSAPWVRGVAVYNDLATGRTALSLVRKVTPTDWRQDATPNDEPFVEYEVGDYVIESSKYYVCIAAHRSGPTFLAPTGSANDQWREVFIPASPLALKAYILANLIDVTDTADTVKCPAGVGVYVMCDYIRPSPPPNYIPPLYQPRGLICFDGSGRVVAQDYYVATGSLLAAMSDADRTDANAATGGWPLVPLSATNVNTRYRSGIGLAFFDPDDMPDSVREASNPAPVDLNGWMATNAATVLVNRYNGTLIKQP